MDFYMSKGDSFSNKYGLVQSKLDKVYTYIYVCLSLVQIFIPNFMLWKIVEIYLVGISESISKSSSLITSVSKSHKNYLLGNIYGNI